MTYITQFTLRQICDIIEVELPEKYKNMADETFTNVAYNPQFAIDGCALVVNGKTAKEREENLERAKSICKIKMVFIQENNRGSEKLEGMNYIFIKSALDAVTRLSAYIRNNLDIKVVGITGSIGKTTTKDFIHSVLAQHAKTEKSRGNQNTIFPLFNNLQKMPRNIKFYVQEFGAATRNIMPRTVRACIPDAAIITNISYPHLDVFGTKENIMKEKLNLITQMPEGCPGFLNWDDELLRTIKLDDRPIITYAVDNKEADYYADNIVENDNSMSFDIVHGEDRYRATIYFRGRYNISNALVAAAIGEWAGVSRENIVEGLASFRGEGIRQNVINLGGYTVFMDCYNCSPVSLVGSVEILQNMDVKEGGRRIAVVTDMQRLGEESSQIHKETAEKLSDLNIDLFMCFGEEEAELMAKVMKAYGKRVLYTNDRSKLNQWIKDTLTRDDIILFKGGVERLLSRSIDQIFGTAFHMNRENFDWVNMGDYSASLMYEKKNHNAKMAGLHRYNGIESVITVPAKVKRVDVFSVGSSCFSKNEEIKKVIIPSPITNIGKKAFQKCSKLKKVILPESLLYIGSHAFEDCISLRKIVIPDGAIHISAFAFKGCKKLRRVIIPSTVKFIGEDVFLDCPKVKVIYRK